MSKLTGNRIMKDMDNATNEPSSLREQAEEILQKRHVGEQDTSKLSPEEMHRLIHELQVHQVELEMQNEELRRTQLELHTSRDKYTHLYDHAPIGYFTISEKGMILEANLTGANLLGLERSVLVGKPFSGFTTRDTQDVFYRLRQGLLETQGPQTCELKIKKKDGSQFHAQLEGLVVHDMDGNAGRFRIVLIDITRRMQAEKALQESRDELYDLYENAPNAFFSINLDDASILRSNSRATELLGYDKKTLMEMNVFDLYDDTVDGMVKAKEIFSRFKAGDVIKDEELRMKHKDGFTVWVSFTATPVKDHHGRIIEGRSVVIDISLRKALENNLIKSKKLESIGTLAGGIAHDFNNLLHIVSGNISMAKDNVSTDYQSISYLSEAENAVLRAKNLTGKFVTFSSGGDPTKSIVSINSLIDEVKDIVLSGSSMQCDFVFSHGPDLVEIDKTQIYHVFINIIENAKHAATSGGVLKIRTENIEAENETEQFGLEMNRGEYVKILISDEGAGIPPENMEKIFDPYFSTKQRGPQKGMGLGLSIAHSIIKKHNGYIHIKSTEGKGTDVYLFFPVSKKQVAKEKPGAHALPGMSEKLLVMDDEEQIRKMTGAMLRRFGYEVELAPDGETAVKLYQEAVASGQPFDAVILDLTVKGGMGGVETIKQLTIIDSDVRALIVSGYIKDPVMSNYKEHGFLAALIKPVTKIQLKESLEKLFSEGI